MLPPGAGPDPGAWILTLPMLPSFEEDTLPGSSGQISPQVAQCLLDQELLKPRPNLLSCWLRSSRTFFSP